jgi:hypothetical protein
MNNTCGCPAASTALLAPDHELRDVRRAWWTGKDSNLRSPQGAADLQSAGFSHSPTRPSFGISGLELQNLKSGGTQTHVPKSLRFNIRSGFKTDMPRRKLNPQKHKKDSCLKTPARSILTTGIAPPRSPADLNGGAGGGN